jgi:hypothetical protein
MNKTSYPKTKSKTLDAFFKGAEKALEAAQRGEGVDGKGPFGEDIQFMALQLAQARSIDVDSLSVGTSAHEKLMNAFRDEIENPSAADIVETLTLCAYGLLLDIYTEEDFRFLYRYSLRYVRNQKPIEKWLKKGLLFLAACETDKPDEIVAQTRFWIQYLGAPLFSPLSLREPAEDLGLELEKVLADEKLRLADAIIRHPQYLNEAVSGRTFHETYTSLRDWGPDVILKDSMKICRNSVYEEAQEAISEELSVSEAIDTVKKVFKQEEFQSHDKDVLPVRLQELPNPPPGDAIDPVIFELIPQKLRVGLLPSVAYSTRTKKIEIIFLGGPRIGRSGILIKTDTGGHSHGLWDVGGEPKSPRMGSRTRDD